MLHILSLIACIILGIVFFIFFIIEGNDSFGIIAIIIGVIGFLVYFNLLSELQSDKK